MFLYKSKCLAFDELRRDEVKRSLRADLVDHQDVRVAERRRDMHLVLETPQPIGIRDVLGRKDFERGFLLGPEEIRTYQVYLVKEKGASWSGVLDDPRHSHARRGLDASSGVVREVRGIRDRGQGLGNHGRYGALVAERAHRNPT